VAEQTVKVIPDAQLLQKAEHRRYEMKTHKMIVEVTTVTNIPLDLTMVQEAIMAVRKDAYVTVREA